MAKIYIERIYLQPQNVHGKIFLNSMFSTTTLKVSLSYGNKFTFCECFYRVEMFTAKCVHILLIIRY